MRQEKLNKAEIDLDSVDVPGAMNIETSSIPSPVDSGKGSDLEETDPVRADNFYTHKEIEAPESLLFAVTDANKPSAPTHPSDQDSDLTFFPLGWSYKYWYNNDQHLSSRELAHDFPGPCQIWKSYLDRS